MTDFTEFKLYKGKVTAKFYGPTPEKPNRHMYFVNDKRKTGVTTYIGIKDKSRALIGWATELAADHLLQFLALEKEICKESIIQACFLHEEHKKEAGNIGQEIHDWAEQYINFKLKKKGSVMPEMPSKQSTQIGVSAFLDWEKEHKVKFISTERVIYSKKYDFIGRMDIEAKIDGDLCLVDLKSSNGLYNDVSMQTAAYVKADEEESNREYAGRWAIRLAKEIEEEYTARMKKKQEWSVIKGHEPRGIKPYQAFETKYLDAGANNIDRDFKAFLAAKQLFEWDKETDFFLNS